MNARNSTPAKFWTKKSLIMYRLIFALVFALASGGFVPAQAPDTVVQEAAELAEGTVEAYTESAADSAEPVPEEAVAEAEVQQDAAAVAYMQKCMGCHTIGGGALSGPDLKPSASWPANNLRDAVIRMEKNVGPMTEEEVEAFTQFILAPDAAERLAAEQKRAALRQTAQMEPGDAAVGGEFFLGRRPFRNGGLSCAACHAVGGRGGNLAVALDDAFVRMGEIPLVAACENPGFPVMRTIYAKTPLTKQEAVHVVKFLEQASAEPQKAATVPLHLIGVIGGAGMMFLLGRGVVRHRAAGTRARLVAAAHRKNNLGGTGR